jgi:hypothetical protein
MPNRSASNTFTKPLPPVLGISVLMQAWMILSQSHLTRIHYRRYWLSIMRQIPRIDGLLTVSWLVGFNLRAYTRNVYSF